MLFLRLSASRSYFRELQLNEEEVPVVPVGGRCFKAPLVEAERSRAWLGPPFGRTEGFMKGTKQIEKHPCVSKAKTHIAFVLCHSFRFLRRTGSA